LREEGKGAKVSRKKKLLRRLTVEKETGGGMQTKTQRGTWSGKDRRQKGETWLINHKKEKGTPTTVNYGLGPKGTAARERPATGGGRRGRDCKVAGRPPEGLGWHFPPCKGKVWEEYSGLRGIREGEGKNPGCEREVDAVAHPGMETGCKGAELVKRIREGRRARGVTQEEG